MLAAGSYVSKFGESNQFAQPSCLSLPYNARLGLCVHPDSVSSYELLLPGAVTRADPSKSAGKEYENECVSVCVCIYIYTHTHS